MEWRIKKNLKAETAAWAARAPNHGTVQCQQTASIDIVLSMTHVHAISCPMQSAYYYIVLFIRSANLQGPDYNCTVLGSMHCLQLATCTLLICFLHGFQP